MKKKVYLYAGTSVIALVAIIIALIITFNTGKKQDRAAKVLEISGTCTVERGGKVIDATKGMELFSEDVLVVGKGSSTRIKIDEDKFIYLGENSRLSLSMTGTADEGKMTAFLERGSMLTEVKHKLSAKSTYEVVTPNTSMDIRGTKTLTEVYEDVLGAIKTSAAVVEGQVSFKTVQKDSTGKPVSVSTELNVGLGFGITTKKVDLLSLVDVKHIADDGKTSDGKDAESTTPDKIGAEFEKPTFSEEFLNNVVAVLARSRDEDVKEGFVGTNITEEELNAAINTLNDVIDGKIELPASVEEYLSSRAQSFYNEPIGNVTPEGRNGNTGVGTGQNVPGGITGQNVPGVITGQNNTGNIGNVGEPQPAPQVDDDDDDDDDDDSGYTPPSASTPAPTPALYEVGTKIDLYFNNNPVGNAEAIIPRLATVEVSGLTNGKAAAGTPVTITVNEKPGVEVKGIQISEMHFGTEEKTLSFNMPNKAVQATVSIEVKDHTIYGWESSVKKVEAIVSDVTSEEVRPGTQYANARVFNVETASAVSSITVTKVYQESDAYIVDKVEYSADDPQNQWIVEEINCPVISIR